MKQFDAYEFSDPGGAVGIVVMQGTLYLDLPSILVAPLFPADTILKYPIINPEIAIAGASGPYLTSLKDIRARYAAGFDSINAPPDISLEDFN